MGNGSDGLTVMRASGADLPDVDGSAPHPFYEQLKRDSLKSRSRGSNKKSALEAAVDAAIAAVDGAAAGRAPGVDDIDNHEGHDSLDLPNLPYGQSLEIEGLRTVYPSLMLDALTAATAAHRGGHAAGGGDQGSAGAAAELAKGLPPPASAPPAAVAHTAANGYSTRAPSHGMPAAAAAAAAGTPSHMDHMDHTTGSVLGEGLSAMQVSLKDFPSLLGLPGAGPFDFPYSKGSKGMSVELPSMLLHVLSGGSSEGVQGGGTSSGAAAAGPSTGKKQLQLADSGLANMLSMGQALEEAVSVDEHNMQQA
jgi:hypothetical protein